MAGRVKIIALVAADSFEEALDLLHEHSPNIPAEHGPVIPNDNPVIYRLVANVDESEKIKSSRQDAE